MVMQTPGEMLRKDVLRIQAALGRFAGPQTIQDILKPPEWLTIRYQREAIHKLDEAIEFYSRHERQLTTQFQLRLNELLIAREQAMRRLYQMLPRERRR